MACLVSVMTLRAPRTLTEEKHPRSSAGGRLLRPVTSRTVIKGVAPKFLDRGGVSSSSVHRHIMASWCEHVSHHHFNIISYITPTVISGFWVGPDVEDGWGFVEALVNQMF